LPKAYAAGVVSEGIELSMARTFNTKCVAAFRAATITKRYSVAMREHSRISLGAGTWNQMELPRQVMNNARVSVVISRKRK
jgi:hypothetical protein